jgi:hypothetical protein
MAFVLVVNSRNVSLQCRYIVKIADFGMARMLTEKAQSQETLGAGGGLRGFKTVAGTEQVHICQVRTFSPR